MNDSPEQSLKAENSDKQTESVTNESSPIETSENSRSRIFFVTSIIFLVLVILVSLHVLMVPGKVSDQTTNDTNTTETETSTLSEGNVLVSPLADSVYTQDSPDCPEVKVGFAPPRKPEYIQVIKDLKYGQMYNGFVYEGFRCGAGEDNDKTHLLFTSDVEVIGTYKGGYFMELSDNEYQKLPQVDTEQQRLYSEEVFPNIGVDFAHATVTVHITELVVSIAEGGRTLAGGGKRRYQVEKPEVVSVEQFADNLKITLLNEEPLTKLIEHPSGVRVIEYHKDTHPINQLHFLYPSEKVSTFEDLPERILSGDWESKKTLDAVLEEFGYARYTNTYEEVEETVLSIGNRCRGYMTSGDDCEIGIFANPYGIAPSRLTRDIAENGEFLGESLGALYAAGGNNVLVTSGWGDAGNFRRHYSLWNTEGQTFEKISTNSSGACSSAILTLGETEYNFDISDEEGVLYEKLQSLNPLQVERQLYSYDSNVYGRVTPTDPVSKTAPWILTYDLGCPGFTDAGVMAVYVFDPVSEEITYLDTIY